MSHSRSLVEVNQSMKIVKELSYEELLQQEASRKLGFSAKRTTFRR